MTKKNIHLRAIPDNRKTKFLERQTELERRANTLNFEIKKRRYQAEIYQDFQEENEHIKRCLCYLFIVFLCLAFWMVILSVLGVI